MANDERAGEDLGLDEGGEGDALVLAERMPAKVLRIAVLGVRTILFHRYDVEDVKSKGELAKGSAERKTEDPLSYLYKAKDSNALCIPGLNIKSALREAAKIYPNPTNKRSSARDLVKATVEIRSIRNLGKNGAWTDPEHVPFLKEDGSFYDEPDYFDTRRVTVQMSAVPRTRPALLPGWRLEFDVVLKRPDLITPRLLTMLARDAGELQGIADFRPEFGLFDVVSIQEA